MPKNKKHLTTDKILWIIETINNWCLCDEEKKYGEVERINLIKILGKIVWEEEKNNGK